MADFTKKQQKRFEVWTVVVVIVASIYFFVFFHTMGEEVPIDLSTNGSITEFTVRIHEAHDTFEMELIFGLPEDKRSAEDIEKFKRFVSLNNETGAAGDGTVIPLKVNIYRLAGKKRIFVKEEIYETKGNNGGYYNNKMERSVGYLGLYRGKYLIKIETLEGFEYLKDITTKINFYRLVAK